MRQLKHNFKGDGFDDWVTDMNWLFGYTDRSLDYPEVDGIKKNAGIKPEWFYEVFAGTPGFSELNAIRLYRSDVNKFDDIATDMAGISMVEMEHYDHLQELILALGGKPDTVSYENSDLMVATGKSIDVNSALRIGIQSERDTIKEYQHIISLCNEQPDSETKDICIQLLNKLIADERKHIEILQSRLDKTESVKDGLTALAKQLKR